MKPVICFGQQPCGIFPKRYLFAKFQTARKLQAEIGGEIVFFYHDSDHDPRETKTVLHNRQADAPLPLNFTFENKLQKKFSPLYLKRVGADWVKTTASQLQACVDKCWIDAFREVKARRVADFCLEMYEAMGLLEGIRVARSSDPDFRKKACAIEDIFVDVPWEGEIVRARRIDGQLKLHKGGDAYETLPEQRYGPEQISPARDSRLVWMQSVLHCTHYIAGAGEQAYLRREDAPEIQFVNRDFIERSEDAYVP